MDVRELILVQLTEIISAIPGIEMAARNLVEGSETRTPMIVLYDGDEEAMETAKPGLAGLIVNMLPMIVLSLGDVAENAGTVANEWRAKILKAVLSNATLGTYTDKQAGAKYVNCTTSLSQGRTMQVELIINLQIAYALIPSRL